MISAEQRSLEFSSQHRWREACIWGISLALLTPMLLTYAIHFFLLSEGLRGTGFLQYDQFYYMANAREHFDAGHFTLLYNLPFSPFDDSPRIYIQPLSLLLGTIQHLSGFQPGHIYVALGIVVGLIFIRVAISLYGEMVGFSNRAAWLVLPIFIWGGGFLALGGLITMGFTSVLPEVPDDIKTSIFRYDPYQGYWFLNLGRNLYYSTEAFYHLLFFSTVLLLFSKRYYWALLCLTGICISHPFTGSQLLGIVLSWSLIERFIVRSSNPPTSFLLCLGSLLIAHFGYYLLFLGTSAEYQVLQMQWRSFEYFLNVESFILAYAGLFVLIFWRVRHRMLMRKLVSDQRNRFLVIWALVSIALANHELFMAPFQPIHFTRGYIWIPLFLLGAPVLVALVDRILAISQTILRVIILTIIFVIACLDNGLWFGIQWQQALFDNKAIGFALSREEVALFRLMNEPHRKDTLVVSSNHLIGYLTTVYSPLRSWVSHGSNTPHHDQRVKEIEQFFKLGQEPPGWEDRSLLVVAHRNYDWRWRKRFLSLGLSPVFEGRSYVAYERMSKSSSKPPHKN